MLWWVLTSLLKHYAIDPIACRDLATATTCVNSFGVAGSIAAIIVGIIGVIALVRLVQPRPIVIALPTAILLWDLSVFMAGLSWWETLLWALFFYTVSYTLFWLAARLNNTVASLALAAVVVIVIRLLLLI
jgi:Ca2+/Na+ antiporter